MSDPIRRRPLDEGEIDAFDHVARALLDQVRVIRTNLLPPMAEGLTMGKFIFLRGDHIEDRTSALLAHELVHVRQFAEMGAARFFYNYLAAYFRNLIKLKSHHAAYMAIPLEEEARAEATRWLKSRPNAT